MRFIFISFLVVICTFLYGQETVIRFLDENGDALPYVPLEANENFLISDAKGEVLVKHNNSEVHLKAEYLGYFPLDTLLRIGEVPININLRRNAIELQTIQVNSSWVREEEPFTATALSGDLLEKSKNVQDIPIVLQSLPSVVSSSDAGNGVGYTQFRIRGTDPTRVNITIDGIPLNEAESQLVYWVDLPDLIESTQAIQMQRGVGPSTNGEGAFGATVNLITQTSVEKPEYTAKLDFGSFTTQKYMLKGATPISKNQSLTLRGSFIKSDGYIDRASSDLYSLYGAWSLIKPKYTTTAKVFHGHERTYQAWNGVPIQYVKDEDQRTFNTAGALQNGSFYDGEVDDYGQTHFHFHHNRILNNGSLSIKAHYTDGGGYYEQYKEGSSGVDYGLEEGSYDVIRRLWLQTDYYGLISDYHLDLNENRKLDIGLAVTGYRGNHFGRIVSIDENSDFDQNLNPYYSNQADKNTATSYLSYTDKIGDHFFLYGDLQYRFVRYQYEGVTIDGNPITKTKIHHFLNPKLGISYDLDEGSQLYASISMANKEPNRNDYIAALATEEPKAEQLIDLEAGFKYRWKEGGIKSNFYWMNYRNQLALTGRLNPVGEYVRANVEKSYRLGLEIEAETALAKKIMLRSSLTLSSNKILDFMEYVDDWDTGLQEEVYYDRSTLAFSPDFTGYVAVDYRNKNWAATIDGKYVGRQYLDNTHNEQRSLDGYFFSNLGVDYTLSLKAQKKIIFRGRINNLTNSLYSANGWSYRFKSSGYNPVPDDPYAEKDNASSDHYHLIGLYPQATINYMIGVTLEF